MLELVENYIFVGHMEDFGPNIDREGRIPGLQQGIKEIRRAGLRLLAEYPGENGPVCPMPFAGSAQTPVKPHLDCRRAGQPGIIKGPCVPHEIVGGAHGGDCMGT